MRVILYTGKGGVGKTSVAAATALCAAGLGYKTVVLSTDAAHSLADSFDFPLGNEPQLIMPNLWGQETDLAQTLESNRREIHDYLAALLAWRGVDDVVADEIAFSPGMEELANLLYILNYQEGGKYEVAIVDCAPTGETLRLLGVPEVLRWWMTRLFPIGRKIIAGVRPLARTLTSMPLPDTKVFKSVEDLYAKLTRLHSLLADAETTSVRLVVNPEKMVIKEARRSFTYFSLYGYNTDLVICNRLIPDRVKDIYFKSWKASQRRYHQLIEESFAPVPVFDVPLFEQEIVGIPMLRNMAEALYGEKDPTAVFYRGGVQSIHKEGKHYVLTITLPFTSKEQISLMQSGDELTIQVAGFRRNVVLPRSLVGLAVGEAKLEEGRLKIRFQRGGTRSKR
jgi:arsenite-transporting ATPase